MIKLMQVNGLNCEHAKVARSCRIQCRFEKLVFLYAPLILFTKLESFLANI